MLAAVIFVSAIFISAGLYIIDHSYKKKSKLILSSGAVLIVAAIIVLGTIVMKKGCGGQCPVMNKKGKYGDSMKDNPHHKKMMKHHKKMMKENTDK